MQSVPRFSKMPLIIHKNTPFQAKNSILFLERRVGGLAPFHCSGGRRPTYFSLSIKPSASAFANSSYTLQWAAPPPSKNCPFPWGWSGPHLIHGSLGPAKSSIQTASRSVQPFLQGSLVWQIDRQDRQTDHATRSVTVGRICVHSTAMRPNNSIGDSVVGINVSEQLMYLSEVDCRASREPYCLHRPCAYVSTHLSH